MPSLVLVTVVATAVALVARRLDRSRRAQPQARGGPGHPRDGRAADRSRWLTVPAAPRPSAADGDWARELFDPGDVADLVALDAAIRSELARERHALVLARMPEGRRERRVRALVWTSDEVPAASPEGRLSLTLADGTSLELDGVSHATALWLGYCHDEFGLVLGTISPGDSSWAARLHSCGWDTPVRASRLRVS